MHAQFSRVPDQTREFIFEGEILHLTGKHIRIVNHQQFGATLLIDHSGRIGRTRLTVKEFLKNSGKSLVSERATFNMWDPLESPQLIRRVAVIHSIDLKLLRWIIPSK
ncbi:hypothetical protein D3C80_1715160 [compost metagenome]